MPTPLHFIHRSRALSLVVAFGLAGCATKTPDDGAAGESGAADGATDGGADGGTDGGGDPITPQWSRTLPRASGLALVRGQATRRAIVHLHSPWSHDACDGAGFEDGVFDEDCLSDLRQGLCDAAIDVAFVTDHPGHAAQRPYSELLLQRAGDEAIAPEGTPIGSTITCSDGARTAWFPGIEDELMPLGLHHHVTGDPLLDEPLYNLEDAATIEAFAEAGGLPFIAHTEQRNLATLQAQVAAGVRGVEMFNLHAAFDPDIRPDFLGLEPIDWLARVGPMTSPTGDAEPDLLVLAVLIEQAPSIANYDALQTDAAVIGVAGSDAHQNVLSVELRDGERGDSYRRMLRWFSNWLRVPEGADAADPLVLRQALEAGRVWVVFEILGTPEDLDFSALAPDGTRAEVGATADWNRFTGGSLEVACPRLSPTSAQGDDPPEVRTQVFKDGVFWVEGCGSHPLDGPGVYRVKHNIVPHHLAPFLGAGAADWMSEYPWAYSNPIRLRESR